MKILATFRGIYLTNRIQQLKKIFSTFGARLITTFVCIHSIQKGIKGKVPLGLSLSTREEQCRKEKVEGGKQCGWELPWKVDFMVPGEEKKPNPMSFRQTSLSSRNCHEKESLERLSSSPKKQC